MEQGTVTIEVQRYLNLLEIEKSFNSDKNIQINIANFPNNKIQTIINKSNKDLLELYNRWKQIANDNKIEISLINTNLAKIIAELNEDLQKERNKNEEIYEQKESLARVVKLQSEQIDYLLNIPKKRNLFQKLFNL